VCTDQAEARSLSARTYEARVGATVCFAPSVAWILTKGHDRTEHHTPSRPAPGAEPWRVSLLKPFESVPNRNRRERKARRPGTTSTAPPPLLRDLYERAEFAKELGQPWIIMPLTTMPGRRSHPLYAEHRSCHSLGPQDHAGMVAAPIHLVPCIAVSIDRHPQATASHFRCLASALRPLRW